MPLSRDEIKSKFTEILGLASSENQARASELLTELSEEYESVLTESENSATRVQELTANNEALRDVNSKLFLKVGHKIDTPPAGDPTPEPPKDTPSFENLFNEKGELI